MDVTVVRREQQQELPVAFGAGDRRRLDREARQSYLMGAAATVVDRRARAPPVAHDAALADLVAAGFELRLDERDDASVRREQRRHDRQDVRSEMNDTSIVTRSNARASSGRSVGVEIARVHAFEHTTRGSVRSRQSSWFVADVERDDARGAAREQHVGEAAGRGADVERDACR